MTSATPFDEQICKIRKFAFTQCLYETSPEPLVAPPNEMLAKKNETRLSRPQPVQEYYE
jgi:hypothetical protein